MPDPYGGGCPVPAGGIPGAWGANFCLMTVFADDWVCRRSVLHPGLTPQAPSPTSGEGELVPCCCASGVRWETGESGILGVSFQGDSSML